jgi:hypothetical protein
MGWSGFPWVLKILMILKTTCQEDWKAKQERPYPYIWPSRS